MSGLNRSQVAEDFAKWVRAQLGTGLVRVVLFGSVARGEDREGSDIDMLIEVRGDPVRARRLLGPRIMEIAAAEGVFVSAIVQSADRLAPGPALGIYKVIEKEGRVLA